MTAASFRRSQTAATAQLALLGTARGFGAAVAAREFFDAPGGIDKLLFAREKRMASSANADFNVLTCRARVIDRAASTDDIGIVVFRMNPRFHDFERARNLRVVRCLRKR
jgi:hypothetical protein